MLIENLNLKFNKLYYEKIGENGFKDELKKINDGIYNTIFAKSDYTYKLEGLATHRFYMKTSYPGAVIGAGYAHGAGINDVDNDINGGFSLDYVTGLPYIPASSVKGVLRSAFKHKELIDSLLGEKSKKINVERLEQRIFGDSEEEVEGEDVFFDAVIRLSLHTSANGSEEKRKEDKRILGSDYITPHKEETKSPVPVLIMKILPDVVLEFRFALSDTSLDEGIVITAEEKKRLFINVLEIFGVGAKTNVGYGVLSEHTESLPEKDPPLLERENRGQNPSPSPRKKQAKEDEFDSMIGKKVPAKVTKVTGTFCEVLLELNDVNAKLLLPPKHNSKDLKVGKQISVQITDICKDCPGIKYIVKKC